MGIYKLYFLPYAGASEMTYKKWKKFFKDTNIEFKVLDYAGHGNRNSENYITTIKETCEDIYNLIKEDNKEDKPFFLAGHCLGAIIAYELCYLISEKKEISNPAGIFISGHGAPDKVVYEHICDMNDEKLINYLYEQGNLKEEMLQKEMRNIVNEVVLPPLRADSKLYESYVYNKERKALDLDFYVLYGNNDWKCPKEEIKRWDEFIESPIKYYEYSGGHYFINNLYKECAKDIMNIILQYDWY